LHASGQGRAVCGAWIDALLRVADPDAVRGQIENWFACIETVPEIFSRLFDDEATPLLNEVRFPNVVWQCVILLMSESGVKGKRKGRVTAAPMAI
jgi:hypothetical protein